jgi:hypothetical protein
LDKEIDRKKEGEKNDPRKKYLIKVEKREKV